VKKKPEGATNRAMGLLHLCRSVTENSPLPMVAVEGITHIVSYVNPAFCRLAAKEADDLIGNPFAEVVPEGERNGCLALLDRVYRTGNTESLADQEHTAAASTPAYWSYTMWAVLAPDGRIAGVMIHVTDTTEATLAHQHREKMSQKIQEINQELLISGIRQHELAEVAASSQRQLFQAQKMESIGRLAGGIAHDFNNLLTAILGFTELAEESLRPDDEVQEYLHSIQKAAERAAMLTSQLLAFARKQIVEPKIVNLNILIRDIDKMLRRLIGEHIELTLVLQPDLGHSRIDPGQFGQVLINLVVNARDAMPGGGRITIQTANVTWKESEERRPGAAGDYVLLTVSDTGTGIDPEMQTHLFEPFFTTKEQGKGTGLGLATCYGIVQQSRGHIQVDSMPGQGTTLSIYLPREAEATLPAPQEAASALPPATGTILLVEDEPMVRAIGAQILRRQGYTVFEAENGSEALRWIDDYGGEIDLLVTDMVMPKMGGRELADRLHVTRPHLKVLYTSGYTNDAIIHQGILDPGLAFLQKPFLPVALAQKVREVLLSE
jgi:PAS domain S-box-containing protein